MTTRRDAPSARDDVLTPDQRFTRDWYKFLIDDRWKETAQQAIAVGTEVAVAHGLNTIPAEADGCLVCLTAELGYAVGDRVALPAFEDANDYGVQLFWNTTNVGFVTGANGLRIMDRTGGVVGTFAAITPGNWQVLMRVRP